MSAGGNVDREGRIKIMGEFQLEDLDVSNVVEVLAVKEVDNTELFAPLVAKKWLTYTDFEKDFGNFQEATGYKFMKKRTVKAIPSSLNATELIYRSVQMVCEKHPTGNKSGCQAQVVLGVKKGCLKVNAYSVIHNHLTEGCRTSSDVSHVENAAVATGKRTVKPEIGVCVKRNTVVDELISKHFLKVTLSSYEELKEAVVKYMKASGSIFVVYRSSEWATDSEDPGAVLNNSYIYYKCRNGKKRSCRKMDSNKSRPYKGISRTDCLAFLRFKKSANVYELTSYNVNHNHDTGGIVTEYGPVMKRFTESELAQVEQMILGTRNKVEIIKAIRAQFNVTVTSKDLRCLRAKVRRTGRMLSCELVRNRISFMW